MTGSTIGSSSKIFECRLEFVGRNTGFGGNGHQYADQLLPAEGHPHPHANARCFAGTETGEIRGRSIIEDAAQRGIQRNLQNHRSFCPQNLWISLLRSRDHQP